MSIASYIEHTLLKPDATPDQIRTLCEEARRYGFAAVCVNSSYVSLAKELLSGTDVLVTSVVGFPLGAMDKKAKAMETEIACHDGADEIDMVIALGRLKSGDWSYVEKDMKGVVAAAVGRPVKVIIETGLLTDDEKIKACEAALRSGAQYVKTSTGFGYGGATVHDVALMKKTVGSSMKIKASGGIRDYHTARAMVEAGADRLGVSAGVAIAEGENHDAK